MGRVVVVGSINLDLVVTCARFPLPGETLLGSGFARFPGGKGANQAVAAARHGANTAMVGLVGRDPFGAEMLAALAAAGVDTRAVGLSAESQTGIAAITVAGGDNTIVVAPGANADLDEKAVAALPLDPDDILVAQLEIPTAAVRAALANARRSGARTILNLAPASRDGAALCALADIVVLNETELALAGGMANPDPADHPALIAAAGRLRSRDGQIFVITLGARGLVASTPAGTIVLPAHHVPVVDTTGAGDCFVGTLAARLLAGYGIADALAGANAAAALSIGVRGAGPSMPEPEAVTAFLLANATSAAKAARMRDPD